MIWKEFPCGCILAAFLVSGCPMLGPYVRIRCDADTYESHCAAARAEFEAHPLGYLLAYCGWVYESYANERNRLQELLLGSSAAEEP